MMRRLIMLLTLGVLLYLAFSKIDLAQFQRAIASAHVLWLAMALPAYFIILPLWAAQWRLLQDHTTRVSFRTMLGIVMATSAALNTTAFLFGEVSAVVLLVARGNSTRSQALSILAMDQLLVGLAKFAIITAAMLVIPTAPWMRTGLISLSIGVGALATLCFLAVKRPSAIARLVPVDIAAGLAPLRSGTRLGATFGLAMAKKAAELAAIICVQRAFHLDLNPSSALVILAALNLATLIPLVPGNIGVYEAAVVVAYSALGVSADQAIAVAVVQHVAYFVALALPGYFWAAGWIKQGQRAPAVTTG